MLLEHQLLTRSAATRRAAEIWRVRERTEHEAAAAFDALARDLAASQAPAPLVALASRCAADERAHAVHCRAIVDALAPGLAPLPVDAGVRLGPAGASASERALHASVALGCVTESLSTALLIEIRRRAADALVRRALDVILEDEVRHSRLGWAHLAHAASAAERGGGRGGVSWIARHVPAMLRAALDDELPELAPARASRERFDLAPWGILDRDDVERICRATIEHTILPGLARYGIALDRRG